MRISIKTQVMAIAVIMLLLSLSSFGLAARTSQPQQEIYTTLQEPIQSGSRPVPVSFFLRQGRELTPETAKEGASDSMAPCPNGFTPARWSIMGLFGHTEWRDVGYWETIKVTKPISAQGSVKFRIWMGYTGGGSPQGEFEFTWRRNEENIAEARNIYVNFQSGMAPFLVEVEAPLINQTPFQIGDIFSIHIRCQNNFDGAKIIYGSPEHASAVVMICNPINIIEIHGCKKKINGIYDDIFQVKPSAMTYIAKVDNVLVTALPETDFVKIDEQTFRSVTWDNTLKPGTHDLEISISYISNDNSTLITFTKQITIKKTPEPNFLGIPLWIINTIVYLVLLIIFLVVIAKLYSWYQERRWLKMSDMNQK